MINVSCSTKYSLAAINQILDFCDTDHAIGHDIGCASRVIIANSALGELAKEAGLKIIINAVVMYSKVGW